MCDIPRWRIPLTPQAEAVILCRGIFYATAIADRVLRIARYKIGIMGGVIQSAQAAAD